MQEINKDHREFTFESINYKLHENIRKRLLNNGGYV